EVVGGHGECCDLGAAVIIAGAGRGEAHGIVEHCGHDAAVQAAVARTGNDDGSTKVATLTMTTNYLAPASTGVVVATGEVAGGGRSTIFTEGRLEDESGTVLATSTGVYKRVRGA
ncbi:MAG: PaaI family thioesterase, partial [Pseudomonadota bacterium]